MSQVPRLLWGIFSTNITRKPFNPLFLILSSLLFLCACSKDQEPTASPPPQTQTTLKAKTSLADSLVEIYMPNTNEPYAYMRNRLISLFDAPTSSSNRVPLDEAIWLMEGGLNELLMDEAYAFTDSANTVEIKTTDWVPASGDSITPSTLENLFRNHFDEAKGYLASHPAYEALLVDVGLRGRRYDGEVRISITSYLGLHPLPYDSPYDAPTVPPAQDDKYVGFKGFCSGGMANTSAWWDVTKQVRAVLPQVIGPIFPGNSSRHNVYTVWANHYQMNAIQMNGEYLPNHDNPLFAVHDNFFSPYVCVTASQQDAYAQEIANQHSNFVNKRYIWNGVMSLTVTKSDNPTNWGYNAEAVKVYRPSGGDPVLTAGDLYL